MRRTNKLGKYIFLFLFGFLLFLIFYYSYYRGEKIISGGEGAYLLNFPLLFRSYSQSWVNNFGTGVFLHSLNFAYVFHLILLQEILANERIVNFVIVYSLYFLPFLAVYLLSLEFSLKPFFAFLIATFYVANPFMINFLKSINQWNMLAAYILPAFLYLILVFYNHPWKLFFFFGLHSLFFAFTNANPPTMFLYQIALVFFVVFASLYKEKKFNFKAIVGKYCLVLSSFILFNFWWILNWFYVFPDASKGYSKEFAISWLRGQQVFIPAFWRVLNFQNLLNYPPQPDYDFLNFYFNNKLSLIFVSFPVFLILYYLLRKNNKPRFFWFLSFFWVVVGFLSKGVKGLFGSVYEFLVYHFPLFHIFKTAEEKWGLLFVFLTTLLVIIILREIRREKIFRFFSVFLFISVCFFLYPFLSGNFLPDYKFSETVIGSRKFLDKPEYQELKNKLNNDRQLYRVLSLPGSWNYQVALQIERNKFYTGNDPILSNTNKPFIAPYNGNLTQRFGVLYDKISHPNYLKLLGLYNIGKIVINKDMYPWFGFREKESVPELEKLFDRQLAGEKNKIIDFYDVGENFLPRFYVPTQIVYSPQSTQYELPELVSFSGTYKRTGFFISPYEKIKEKEEFTSELVREKANQILLVGELQSAIDEGKLKAGIRGMNPGGVLFPYARWKPGGLVYPYILKREEKIKAQFADQPEKLLEQNLFFAGKRVFEIQKWDRRLNDEVFLDVLKRFEGEMKEAIENLEKKRIREEDTFLLLAKIEVSFEAFSERLLDVVRGDFGKESKRFRLVKETKERIDKNIKAVLKNYSQPRYYFEIPEEGEYEVLLEKEGGIPGVKIENITPQKEEKFILEITGKQEQEQEEKSWFSFGKQKFKAGEYILVLNQTPAPNLLNENWNILKSEVEAGETIRLFSRNNTPTVGQEIKNWEPETAYKLSFKYRTAGGKLKLSLIEEKSEIDTTWFEKGVIKEPPSKTEVLLEEELTTEENSSDWQEYSVVVYSGRNIKGAKLFISAEGGEEKIPEVEFKQASLIKIFEPKMILRKTKNQTYPVIPQITFRKINPAKYILEINEARDPYFLIFSESFHQGWRAYIRKIQNPKFKIQNEEIVGSYFDGEIKEIGQKESWFDRGFYETWGKRALPEERHLLMNGYANCWYITPADAEFNQNYQIIIEYWPQRLFYIGWGVTLATIIGSLTLLIVKKLRNVKKD